jgi:hypothetical protein
MKNGFLNKALPHIIAIVVFFIVSFLYCKPAFQGNELNQGDVQHWRSMAQNAFDYKEKHGHFPLWNPSMFSGMPNYQTAMEGRSALPDLNKVFALGLPKPANFFFIAALCFYILCLSFPLSPLIAVSGGLAYAFCTYNPVIISVGHETKMVAISYMPLLLAGLICTYEKKYWIGLALTTLGTAMEIGSLHPQVNYYFFMIALAVTIAYLVQWIKRKEWKHLGIAMGITAIAGITGMASNALSFLTSSEYAKATMRGGKTVNIEGDKVTAVKTTGLDVDYAFSYSMKPIEPLVMLMPNAVGGSSSKTLDENSHVVEKLTARGVQENQAVQVATGLPAYWGGMTGTGEVGTSGPPYLGAIIFILAIIGFVIIRHPVRWGLLAVSILAVIMSWGRFLPGFNGFLLKTLPLYDKFRAPSMILIITQLTLPLVAVLALEQLYKSNARELLQKNFKPVLYAVGGLFALLAIIYFSVDFSSGFDTQIFESIKRGGNDDLARATLAGMKEDRAGMFGGQILRSLAFAVLIIGLLWLYTKNIIKKPAIIIIILGLVNIVDLIIVDRQYLNDENYKPKEEASSTTATEKTTVDELILKDRDPDFRVFNTAPDRFTETHTSHFHKSLGGYHPAKLRIYQDIIERFLSETPNPQVLNALNARYILLQNQQGGQQTVVPNADAYGSCWLVKNVRFVTNDADELQTIGKTDLKDTAIVQQRFSSSVTQPQWDSTSSISLTKFDNDTLEYTSDCKAPQFAVFSEVYYPFGWNAFIDGKKFTPVKTDYVLRGLSIPAGKHAIKFIFQPSSYVKGDAIGYAGSWLIIVIVLGGFFMAWWQNKKSKSVSS